MRTPPLTVGLAALGMLAASSASAEIGALDPVPSATLLFPYFEAETGDDTDKETLLIIENTAAAGQLAHVIVWTDRGVPVLDFDLYLVAHGQQRLAMRSLLDGNLPSSSGGTGTGCSFPLDDLDDDAIADLQAALTGKHMPSVADDDEGCPGAAHGDTLARGYVTVDTVTACSTNQVTAGSYWSAQLDIANTLLGSFVITEGEGKPSYGEQAIHIEASDTDTRTNGADDSTFYGNLVAWSGDDHRERVPGAWYAEVIGTRSDVIVWRDTKRVITDPETVGCSSADQSALDLSNGNIAYFDEAETITLGNGAAPFARATGRYEVGGSSGLPMPYRSGMIAANLNFGANGDAAAAAGLSQAVVMSVRRPDAVGAATNATLSLGSVPIDGFLLDGANAQIINGDSGATSGGGNALPRAMLDPRAAATLVLPYFEVALDDPNQAQTQFSITNNTASALLTNVTLFTDRGVPTISFPVYLTGYDIASIDLRLLFQGGLAAFTATAGQDPQDSISAHGNYSQDINFASCGGILPFQAFDADKLAFLRAAHTGQPVDAWDGQCGGRDLDDGIARGYIVIDDYVACVTTPYQASHENNNPIGTRDLLSGSFTVRNRDQDFSYGGALIGVHETSSVLTAGDATFYGWLNGWGVSGSTRREGLPNAYRVPFVNDDALGSTELILFRPVNRTPAAYACDDVPSAFEGSFASAVAYDDDDNSTTLDDFEPGFVAGRIPIGDDGFEVPYAQGSIELDLNFPEAGGPADVPDAHMGYVGAVHHLAGSADPIFVQGFPLHLAGEP